MLTNNPYAKESKTKALTRMYQKSLIEKRDRKANQ